MTIRVLAAVAAAIVACTLSGSASAASYRYFGLRVGVRSGLVSLVTAVTPGDSHVAVWIGTSSRRSGSWVQGGVAKVSGFSPFAYIEVRRAGRLSLRCWPVSLGQSVRVRLAHHASMWAVTVAGHSSRFVRVAAAVPIAVVEVYGTATGVGVVAGRRVVAA